MCIILVNTEDDTLIFSDKSSLQLPNSFEECVDYTMNRNSLPSRTQQVQRHCLDMFVNVNHTTKWRDHFTEDEQNFISSIFRKLISETHNLKRRRRRRDITADKLFAPRERREIRDPPYSHFKKFAIAVRRLKRQKVCFTVQKSLVVYV